MPSATLSSSARSRSVTAKPDIVLPTGEHVLRALESRRSVAAGLVMTPGPNEEELHRILTIAARVRWLAAIIIGGIAGWLAGRFMKNSTGMMMNIILSVVGAVLASLVLGLFGISFGGWIRYLIAGSIGAYIIIAIAKAVSGRHI